MCLQVSLKPQDLWLFFDHKAIILFSLQLLQSDWVLFFASEANGTSDDIDQPLRRLFADQDLVKSYGLMSLNSVNWSRVMIQLAHFIYTYLELSGMEQAEADGELPELEVVVPTGGAGNIAGELITAVRQNQSGSQSACRLFI